MILAGDDGRRGEEWRLAEKALGEVAGRRGEEFPAVLYAELALSASSAIEGLGGWVDLMNSANSEYARLASPSVSIRLTIARSSVSEA